VNSKILAIATAVLIAGCAGGGHIPSADRLYDTPQSASVRAAGGSSETVSVRIAIPNAKSEPALDPSWGYVSPGTRSIVLDATPNDGTAVRFASDVLPSTPGCRATKLATLCTFNSVVVPAGRSKATVAGLDGVVTENGAIHGHTLSFGEATIDVARKGQKLAIAMTGVYFGVGAAVPSTLQAGKAAAVGVTITTFDAAGYTIAEPNVYLYGSYPGVTALPVELLLAGPAGDPGVPAGFRILVNGRAGEDNAVHVASSKDRAVIEYSGTSSHDLRLSYPYGKRGRYLTFGPRAGFGKTFAIAGIGLSASLAQTPDRNLWYTEPKLGSLAYVTPSSGVVTQYPLPAGRMPLDMISVGTEHYKFEIAVAESNDSIAVITGRSMQEYPIPTNNAGLGGLWSHDGQSIWFTERTAGKIGELYDGPHLSEWKAPPHGTPAGVADGYFTDPGTNATGIVGRETVSENKLPHANSGPAEMVSTWLSPTTYWFTEANAARVGRITSLPVKRHEFATHAALTHIAMGPDNWAYATDVSNDIEMIDPTGNVTVIPNPDPGSELVAIAGGVEGDVWVLASRPGSSKIYEVLY
jgi:virginiamycin B lyase